MNLYESVKASVSVPAAADLDYTEYLAEILTKEKQEAYRGKESKTA